MTTSLPSNISSFVWHFLRPYRRVVICFVCMALLAGFWGPFNSMLIKYIINILATTHGANLAMLTGPAALLVLNFIIFDNVTWRSLTYLNYKYQILIKNSIISETLRYVLGASQEFFQDNLSGRLSGQINTLADNIERILHNVAADLIRGLSLLIVALVSMYFVNPLFCFILALWFLVFSTFSIVMSKHLVILSDNLANSATMISGQLVDSITNVNNIRIFARSGFEIGHLDHSLLDTKKSFRANELFLLKLHSGQGALIAIMLGFMVYFLIHLFSKDEVTIGDFALILGLGMEVAHVTWYTMSQVDEFHQAIGKCKQSLSRLIVPHEIQDQKNAQDIRVTKGRIVFANVKFHYKGSEPLFQNKSITIESGQKVGLVGYSGGGKTTFANLIMRLYDVTAGSISIDDQDISLVTQDSLRRNISMIPQDPSLFHRSLMENIRYGRIDASDEEVIAAAKQAHAHEFIIKLPRGYESPVGERGIKLSGGQRQRIAIARAILKNAPILILDEATSQLDSVTENYIQASLAELMQNKTTIVIAHRLSTLLHMDRILVFDKGKIVEEGAHRKLIAKAGLYAELWKAQVGGFLVDSV